MTAGLVRALGPQDYGLLVVVLAVSALSLTINPAIAAATTKFVAESIGSGSDLRRTVPRVISASMIGVILISVLFLVATIALRDPLARLLFGAMTVTARPELGSLLVLAVFTVVIQQIDGVFSASLKGLEKFKQQALFELSSKLATAALVIEAGFATRQLSWVLVVNCTVLSVSAFLRGAFLRTMTPGGKIFAKPETIELRQLVAFGSWMWLSATASVAYGSVDRIIVGRVLGSIAVAEYQLYVQLAQLIHYIPSSLFAFALPAFSRLNAGNLQERRRIATVYRKLMHAVLFGALALAIFLVIFERRILSLFSAGLIRTSDTGVFNCLVVGFILLAVNVAPYYLLLGLGKSKRVSLVTSVSVAMSIGISFDLIPLVGLMGAAVARLVYVFGTLILLAQARHALAVSDEEPKLSSL